MTPENYQKFMDILKQQLEAYDRVLGLIAVGSMAGQDYEPDEWSDHDFFVIVRSGEQESFRNNFNWLPFNEQIVFSYRETAHGVKVLYKDGHLLEFAIFDLQELYLARVNRYRVLLDRSNMNDHLNKIRQTTLNETSRDEVWLIGQFLTNLLVGVMRHRRGEQLSGHYLVKESALKHLLFLLNKRLDSETKFLLDDLDPFRRFELAFPELGKILNKLLNQDTPVAAQKLLLLAEQKLKPRLPNYPTQAAQIVLERITLLSDY